MKLFLFFLFVTFALFLTAETEIPAGDIFGTWNQSGSPYHIMGNLTVPENEILNIDSGCEVIFQGHYNISVNGSVSAFGTEADSIRFTAANSDLGWKGFDLFYAEDDTEVISSIFQYCVFENAIGDGGYWDKKGGAISLKYGNQLILQNCSFRNNEADYGGAIYAKYADIIIDNCLFENNIANNDAGAVYLGAETAAEISNTIFTHNECTYDGGAVYVVGEAEVEFNNCDFSYNSCFDDMDASGGGVAVWGSVASFENCSFINNWSQVDSGALEISFEADVSIISSEFLCNSSGEWGGAISIYQSTAYFELSTLAFNTSRQAGGLNIMSNSEVTFSENNRCDIYHNKVSIESNLGNDINSYNIDSSTIYLDKFTVLEPTEEYVTSYDNVTFEINEGVLQFTDQDIFVSPAGSILNSGLSEDDAVPSISLAIKMAIAGDNEQIIHVAEGHYSPSLTNETFPYDFKNNLKIIGEGAENTIIDVEKKHIAIRCEEVNNWELSGLSIKNSNSYNRDGMTFYSSSGTLKDLRIYDHRNSGWNGILFFDECESICMENIEIYNNKSNNEEIFGISESNVDLAGCSIHHNRSINRTGGIGINSSNVNFSEENLNSIYYNTSGATKPYDISVYNCNIEAILDTFTVVNPNGYFCAPMVDINLTINNGYIEQIEGEIYVALDGSDENSGASSVEPLRSLTRAFTMLDTSNEPGTIHLAEGNYDVNEQLGFSSFVLPENCTIVGGENGSTKLINNDDIKLFSLTRNNTALRNLILENMHIFVDCYNFILEEVEIRNSNYSHSDGFLQIENSTGEVINCRIHDNVNTRSNAGVAVVESSVTFSGGSIRNNKGTYTSGLIINGGGVLFDEVNRLSIYNNEVLDDFTGADLCMGWDNVAAVYLDTFTVAVFDPWFCGGIEPDIFDVNHAFIKQVDGDIYVSPDGDDSNSGETADDPIKTLSLASKKIKREMGNSIHLAAGVYRADAEGELFPVQLKDGTNWSGAGSNTTIIDGCHGNRAFVGNYYDWSNNIGNISLNNMKLQNCYDVASYHYTEWGGAVKLNRCDVDFNNVIFYNNKSYGGSAVSSIESNIRFDKCIFYDNETLGDEYNASVLGIYKNQEVVITNSTFRNNDFDSGQIIALYESNLALVNTILWDEIDRQILGSQSYNGDVNVNCTNCCVRGGESSLDLEHPNDLTWAEGNIDSDPFFQNSWQLSENSPCIDAGTDSFSWDGSLIFEMQEDEYAGSAPDMGAYEYGMTDFELEEIVPLVYNLKQNYPNPFNPETTISYSIPKDGKVSLEIYNIKGQKVRTLVQEKKEAGSYEVVWSGTDDNNMQTASGIYFYKIKAGKFERLKKMVLLK